jgi:type I restriction enzyme S subunit
MFYLRMLAYQNVFLALATGIRERSCDLRWNKIADLLFPLPSYDEQVEIGRFISSSSDHIDFLISDIQTQIEKLKEYRQSIISEVVTGKVAI